MEDEYLNALNDIDESLAINNQKIVEAVDTIDTVSKEIINNDTQNTDQTGTTEQIDDINQQFTNTVTETNDVLSKLLDQIMFSNEQNLEFREEDVNNQQNLLEQLGQKIEELNLGNIDFSDVITAIQQRDDIITNAIETQNQNIESSENLYTQLVDVNSVLLSNVETNTEVQKNVENQLSNNNQQNTNLEKKLDEINTTNLQQLETININNQQQLENVLNNTSNDEVVNEATTQNNLYETLSNQQNTFEEVINNNSETLLSLQSAIETFNTNTETNSNVIQQNSIDSTTQQQTVQNVANIIKMLAIVPESIVENNISNISTNNEELNTNAVNSTTINSNSETTTNQAKTITPELIEKQTLNTEKIETLMEQSVNLLTQLVDLQNENNNNTNIFKLKKGPISH